MDHPYDLKELVSLRRELHKFPDLSGNEQKTVSRLLDYIKKHNPDEIIENIGGNSFAIIYRGKNDGPNIMFRSDLDALPIEEINDLSYKSSVKNCAHLCGHDGHMTMLSGMAPILNLNRPKKGAVILLFQAEEETGQGAAKVVNDKKFKNLNIDYVFGMHNIPGYPEGSIIFREEIFSSASSGLILDLTGKSSHAGEPENGINPALAIGKLIEKFNLLYKDKRLFYNFVLITIIMINLGERAFGTNPGNAQFMATFRSYRNDDMELLVREALQIIKDTCLAEKLKCNLKWVEEFPALKNHAPLAKKVKNISIELGLDLIEKKEPFKWSEDFAHFVMNYPGAFWGIGSGVNMPQLHNPNYDFPDAIIPSGIAMFEAIYKHFLNN